ncbi:NADPH-dependent FMN reductase [Rhizobium mesosinicum]|uniref:NAD(P)H-dependent oxidoreductase n=1 Tax=Rhizobium mesosinicum TaxID=335017 RepID=A0ABS7GM77_9HYPH|nr:NADPH-dependent FMN reductase [Rhizobium mesosinicum]MBW9051080.1 NAD(P)H-dependent oxidoreductase [Rhizobium mesosinicum]
MKIIAISGSLRAGSYNTALMREAVSIAPEGMTIIPETINGIPLYNTDEEKIAAPTKVAALKDLIASADGLLLFTPEYNNSLPGVFKNAIDWLSSPDADAHRVFRGRPTGILGASATGFGTINSQTAWLPVLRALQTNIFTRSRFLLSRAQHAFDPAGRLADEKARLQLLEYLEEFSRFVGTSAR